MIGHFVNHLSTEQEEWLLIFPFSGGNFRRTPSADGNLCLVERVGKGTLHQCAYPPSMWRSVERSVQWRYDAACLRFGEPRINAAIRNRILANQARRVLKTMGHLVLHG